MDRRSRLKDIIKSCEARFGRGAAEHWVHRDYADLNLEILHGTGVNISANTLKRIFGKISVDDDYLPQQATIDALIKYSAYLPSETETFLPATEETPKTPTVNNSRRIKTGGIIAIVCILVAIGVLIWKFLPSKPPLQGSIKQTAAEGSLPVTVFFDLKLRDTRDSVFIDFGDKSAPVHLPSNQKKLSHNYLFPGVFRAKLRVKNITIDSTAVFVGSNKWIGLGYHRQAELPERYYQFPAVKTGPDSLFQIANSQLYRMGMDTARSFFTRLCNYTATGHSSDDFVFETTFKNALLEKGIYCSSTQLQISGIDGFIRFKLVSPGCSFHALNVVGEHIFDGRKTNLSAFVCDLENWNTVKLINRKKQLSLQVNNKLVFEGSYEKPLGEIKGVFIEFNKNGWVKSCDLKTPDGNTLFHF